jgi:hypothetical protein
MKLACCRFVGAISDFRKISQGLIMLLMLSILEY